MAQEFLVPQLVQQPTFRRLASNLSLLTVGEMTAKVFTFLAFAYLARVLGPSSFGNLEFALAAMVFLNLFVDFGSSPYGAREVALDPQCLPRLLSDIVRLRLVTATIACAAIVALTPSLVEAGSPLRPLLWIYALTLFGAPGFVQWVFQGFDQMRWVALGSMTRWFLFAVGVFVAVHGPEHLVRMGWVEAGAVLGFAAFNLSVLRSRFKLAPLRWNTGTFRRSFMEALPMGLSELTWASTMYFATILVGILLAGEDVGWFSAAHRPIMTLHTFVWLYFYNLLPSISRCREHPPEVLRALLAGSIRITAWSSIFAGLLGSLYAAPLIRLVFGPGYEPAAAVFATLVWIIPVALLSGHYRYALIGYGHQKYEFFCSAGAAAVSILVGLALIPGWGIRAAAWAILASSLFHLGSAFFLARRRVGRLPLLRDLARPLLAGGVMLVIFLLLDTRPVLAGAVGSAAYLLILALSERSLWRPGR